MHILRLCSVYEPPPSALLGRGVRFDPMGGMQIHAAKLSGALDGLGVRQTVVTTRPPDAPALARLGRHGRVVRLGLPVAAARQGYGAAAWLRAPGLADGLDLVHAHLGEDRSVLPAARHVAAHARAPLVVTVHRGAPRPGGSWPAGTLGARLERHVLGGADAVIALTEGMRDELAKDGVPGERLHVVPSGIGAGFLAELGTPELGEPVMPERIPTPRIGYVGRLARRKGVDVLLRAFALLRDRTDAHLVIVGDGPERSALQRLAARLRIDGRTHFLGFVPHEYVPRVLRELNVLALPARHGGLGTVLPEAMHSRVPVVASRTGGVPELVEHRRTGLLVSPDNPEELAAALRELLESRALARAVTVAARRRVNERTWDRLVHRVMEVYEGVVPLPVPERTDERTGERTGGREPAAAADTAADLG
ncbi:glycosyltransferase family 4 protein [Actinomadura sp. WMMB 499]|uniref:glycosyltransferase family 4 protein n=1 Tax=Actinomadura sp. WMMB 499 TaxID=1219491 RepID=UPI001243F775|nr:glycosyltransferase family 4 protein [Actinomadura sp. WMMB 499]QFG22620.1 glycosyltransferase family 4 protein [Actinomadura sp. WMMB 499]